MRHSRSLLRCLGLAAVASFSTADAQVVAVDWDAGGTSGSMGSTAVTVSGFGGASTFIADLTGTDFSAAPLSATQECASYDSAANWTATFSQPVPELFLYAVFWRGSFGGPNPVTYTFDRTFTIVSGLASATVTGNTISLPNTGFHDGIIRFGGPVTSLSCATNAACCSNQALTFAAPACAGSVTTYGAGCPGTGGFVPTLALTGCPVAGTQVSVELAQALAPSNALFFLGLNQTSLPAGGGCDLLVTPVLAVFIVPVGGAGPGNGTLSLPGVLPMNAGGASFTMQAWVTDPVPGGIGGVATNGLAVTVAP